MSASLVFLSTNSTTCVFGSARALAMVRDASSSGCNTASRPMSVLRNQTAVRRASSPALMPAAERSSANTRVTGRCSPLAGG